MGVVYLAEQESLNRTVALKVVRPDQDQVPGTRARFRREVEAVAGLQHPGIVPVHSTGDADGLPFFVMEYVVGCTLAELLHELSARRPDRLSGSDLGNALAEVLGRRRVSLPTTRSGAFDRGWVEVCVDLCRQVAEALDHAHRRGIVHRDVKPSNILITPEGYARLIDFGLASREGDPKLTRTGTLAGSLAYMAPELVAGGSREADVRGDVYSLGITLYELLTLELPYVGSTSESTRRQILEGSPASIRKRNPTVPRDVEIVCLAALDRDPFRRYQSMALFAGDLTSSLGHRPIRGRSLPRWLRLRRWTRRHPGRASLVSVGMVVLLATAKLVKSDLEIRRDYERHHDILVLDQLVHEVERLFASGNREFPVQQWLERGETTARHLSSYRQELLQMRGRSDLNGKVLVPDPTHERRLRLVRHMLEVLDGASVEGRESLREHLEKELAEVEERIATHRLWEFEDPRIQLAHDELSAFVPRLEAFTRAETGLLAQMRLWIDARERHKTVMFAPPGTGTSPSLRALIERRKTQARVFHRRDEFEEAIAGDANAPPILREDWTTYEEDAAVPDLFGGLLRFSLRPVRVFGSPLARCKGFSGKAAMPEIGWMGQPIAMEFREPVFGIGADVFDDFDGTPFANTITLQTTTPGGLVLKVLEDSPWVGCGGFIGVLSAAGIVRAEFAIDAPDANFSIDQLTLVPLRSRGR